MARARKQAEPAGNVIDISKGTVRIGERTMTIGLAESRGLIVRVEGGAVLTDLALQMQDRAGTKAVEREARAHDWRRRQGIAEPETTADGRLIEQRKKVEPLKPRNVDHSGQEITDEEELARIAAETEALEAARIAAEEDAAAGLVIPPPAEPTEAEIEAEGRADEAD